ncbi:L-threonylcarbamoyladenylate synthase [Cognatiyoonia sp. IB215182]|uniref:L-threonylcarbamoyladenylate synthase n=1 Tax=Cognatiyoonia sp. IB215182 TaxID=3097353 RepID=UPI002A14018D|nr:L-threonylcarbamoyladenylate synthase [Cognatiyoonia sp. IB215182]MDX8352813.1 L-threonylcarbamoyladenylate synthase [Cognatiyoonia sp. IB215182]
MSQATLRILSPDEAGLSEAAGILQQGGLVSFPTETVYGLGADARNDRAVAGIFAAKGRPSFNPLIVHVAGLETAAKYVHFNDTAERLAAAFWPGALTLVLPLRADTGISKVVTAGLDSLAVRVPDHAVAQGLLRRFAGPVAAPSANPSGRVSPTSAAHVIAGLGNKIDAVVDGGDCPVGLESTIVSCIGAPALLRAGGIPAERIEDCLGALLRLPDDPQTPTAPGQLASHYAPAGSVRLNANAAREDEVLLGFGPVEADLNLSPSGDLTEAAARLFACLHALDEVGATAIAVSPIPDHGLGRAINDRLRRAAAPRD